MKLPDINIHVHTHYPDLEKVMSAISDFAAKQTAFNEEISADLDAIKQQAADLNSQIAALKSQLGQLSAEDQAALDKLASDGAALASKADATAGKTPPAPPADNPPATQG